MLHTMSMHGRATETGDVSISDNVISTGGPQIHFCAAVGPAGNARYAPLIPVYATPAGGGPADS